VRGGNGGAGLASSISGAAVIYAGGGGGGAERGNFGSETGGSGGSGGGGGGSTGNGNNGGNGTNNRGSGGGGAGNDANGGNGGSGIVILRYKGTEAGTGGTPGTGTAAGYTLHTFTSTGESALDLSNLDLSTRLGAVENGVISGSGDLTFTGPGTLTLKAANTYSGLTRINAGTLALGSGGSIGSSSGVSIANGSNFNVSTVTGGFTLGGEQTLSGGGTIAGDVTISGTHRPGFSPGIQVFADDLTYTVGSNVVWELIDDTVSGRGTEYDGVDVSGDLTFTGSTTITLDFALLGSMVDWTNEFWNNDYTGTNGWKVFDVGGEITGFENLTLEGSMMDKNGTSLTSERSGASFFLFEGADGVYLNYAVVPEPSAALLAGLGLLALLRRRR
jgi:autotransporter-associated beta strand protein